MKTALLKYAVPSVATGGIGVGGTVAYMNSSRELTIEEKREINRECGIAAEEYSTLLKIRGYEGWTEEKEKKAAKKGREYCEWWKSSYFDIYNFSPKFKDV